MPRIRSLLIPPMLLALAACHTQAYWAARDGKRDTAICVARLETDPALAMIAPHMPLDGGPASAGQQLDRSVPTRTQRIALRAWKAAFDECRQITVETLNVTTPDQVPPLFATYRQSDAVIDSLLRGRVTWGAANRQRETLANGEWQRLYGPQARRADVGPILLNEPRVMNRFTPASPVSDIPAPVPPSRQP